MSELGFELLLRFIWGSLLLMTIVSREQTTERFPRIGAWILTALAACDVWLAFVSTLPRASTLPAPLIIAAGALAYAYGRSGAVRAVGFFGAVFAPAIFLSGKPIGAWLNFVSAAYLFGAVFVAQYLGHWFLTVPGLHIDELKRVTKALMIALGLRTLEVAYTLFVRVGLHAQPSIDSMGRPLGIDVSQSQNVADLSAAHSLFQLNGPHAFGLGFYGWMILATRLLWGILAPIVLAWMIRETVRTRSTQSATGILYALSVMVLLGEGTALYLKNALGWFV